MKCEQATKQLRKDFINKVHRHATDPYYVHLLGCPSCRQQQEYLQLMYTLFQDIPKARPTDALVAELQTYFSENISARNQKKKRRIGFLFWPAVVTCCLMALVFYLKKSGKMVHVQEKVAEVSFEWRETVSQWMDQISERSQTVGQTVIEKVGFAKDAVMQTVTGQSHVPTEGNFDKISKNLNQSVNAKLNPKTIPQKKSVEGLRKDNTLFDRPPGESVIETQILDEGTDELDQILADQKQQKKFVHDKIESGSDTLLDAEDQDFGTNVEDEGDVLEKDLANAVSSDDANLQQKLTPQNENADTELQPCAFAPTFSSYDDVKFGEASMMPVATETSEGHSSEDFILSTARRFYHLNWRKQEMGVMGDVVLSPSIPTGTTMAVDVVTEAPGTDVLSALRNQFVSSPSSEANSMKLTLNKPRSVDDVKLQQLIQELDAEDMMNLNAMQTVGSDDLRTEPVLDPDEVDQVLDKYHIQYCAEDPVIMSERQYSFNE